MFKMKIFCMIVCILSTYLKISMSTTLECSYQYTYGQDDDSKYFCEVENDLNIFSSESAVITEATGSHKDSKSNDDVLGFNAYRISIEFFPRGLDKFFKNLIGISINYGPVKKIYSSDLKPFPQLELLDLSYNDIEIIEEGLFDNNPKMTTISFYKNKILQIHSNVFDHLTQLNTLSLTDNQCINLEARNNSTVSGVIKETKLKCSNLLAYNEVQKLKSNFNQKIATLESKIESLEKAIKDNDENLNKFKLEMLAAVQQIAIKLETPV